MPYGRIGCVKSCSVRMGSFLLQRGFSLGFSTLSRKLSFQEKIKLFPLINRTDEAIDSLVYNLDPGQAQGQ